MVFKTSADPKTLQDTLNQVCLSPPGGEAGRLGYEFTGNKAWIFWYALIFETAADATRQEWSTLNILAVFLCGSSNIKVLLCAFSLKETEWRDHHGVHLKFASCKLAFKPWIIVNVSSLE